MIYAFLPPKTPPSLKRETELPLSTGRSGKINGYKRLNTASVLLYIDNSKH